MQAALACPVVVGDSSLSAEKLRLFVGKGGFFPSRLFSPQRIRETTSGRLFIGVISDGEDFKDFVRGQIGLQGIVYRYRSAITVATNEGVQTRLVHYRSRKSRIDERKRRWACEIQFTRAIRLSGRWTVHGKPVSTID